jgi:hypothetical protein
MLDKEKDDVVRATVSQDRCSDTVYWGIVPQELVYIALPAYQMVRHVGGEDTDGQHNIWWAQLGLTRPSHTSPQVTGFPIRPGI